MSDVKIELRQNGPLRVEGPISLIDHEGNAFDLGDKDASFLCRCGASGNKPFCDGSHKSSGFQASETASSE